MTPFVLVTGDLVPTGGMDAANHALASFLARTGYRIELVTHRAAPELIQMPNVIVRPARKPVGSYFLGRWPLRWTAGWATRKTGGRVVANGGNFTTVDVNWVHYVHAAHCPGSSASPLRMLKGRIERRLELSAERAAVRAAKIVVCNSERTRRDVIDLLGANPDRTVTVYYGTDPARFRPVSDAERADLRARFEWAADRPVVMFVGALGDRRKGFDTLFAAWSRLCKGASWDAVLVVVGRGAELVAWEDRARAAGLTDRVRFLGFRSDVPDLLRAADALASPTRYEAYGLSVHEALCCGLPAIVSAAAGVAERYPPELAALLLPNSDDEADLAARLQRWREGVPRESVREFGERLREHTWDDMGRAFLNAIGEPV